MSSGISVPILSTDLTEICPPVYGCASLVSKYTASGYDTKLVVAPFLSLLYPMVTKATD